MRKQKLLKKLVVRLALGFLLIVGIWFTLILVSIDGINAALTAEYKFSDTDIYLTMLEVAQHAELFAEEDDLNIYEIYPIMMGTSGVSAQFLDEAAIYIRMFQFLKGPICAIPLLDVTTLNFYAEADWEEVFPDFQYVNGVVSRRDGTLSDWYPETPEQFYSHRLQFKSACTTTGVSFYSDFALLLDYHEQGGEAVIPYYTVMMQDDLDEWFRDRLQTYVNLYLVLWVVFIGMVAILWLGAKAKHFDT